MNAILLVDSETIFAESLKTTLKQFRIDVHVADSSNAARALLRIEQFDLILIDFDLSPRPAEQGLREPMKPTTGTWSGTGLTRELRASGVACPMIVYTNLEGELYETASLDAGADDFLLKTTPISLLLSRLHAHLRRRARDLGTAERTERRVAIGRFTLDRKARILLADERPVVLATREMILIEKLASNPSRVFPQEEILNAVWGNHLRRSHAALAGVIRRLRQKMLLNGLPDPIENVRGRGFRLMPALSLSMPTVQFRQGSDALSANGLGS
jgi:DNA-binding response OmpR family regulator